MKTDAIARTIPYAAPVGLAAGALLSFAVPSLAAPALLAGGAYLAHRLRDPLAGLARAPVPVRPGPDTAPDAEGTHYVGTEDATARQVWLSDADLLRHAATFGTTGSGKTEVMIGIGANALARGSGFLHVDGKGDVALYPKVAALVRRLGREDDLLVLDMLTDPDEGDYPTHSFNPLATGGHAELAALVAEVVGDGASGTPSREAVEALLRPVLACLVELRDAHGADLTFEVLCANLNLERVVALGRDPRLSAATRDVVTAHLATLEHPGSGHVADARAEVFASEHEWIAAHLRDRLVEVLRRPRVFGSHVADVDLRDVVARGRVLLVLLPPLTRSAARWSALARTVGATLRRDLAAAAALERASPRRASGERPSPFHAILDDVGGYAPRDAAAMLRDATTANVAVTLGFQQIGDMAAWPAFDRVGTVRLMRIEDEATYATAVGIMADGLRGASASRRRGVARHAAHLQGEGPDLPTFREVRSKREGEMFLSTGGRLLEVTALYADPLSHVDRARLRLTLVPTVSIGRPRRGVAA